MDLSCNSRFLSTQGDRNKLEKFFIRSNSENKSYFLIFGECTGEATIIIAWNSK